MRHSTLYQAPAFSQTQSETPRKQIKKQYTCFELLPPTLGIIMHCFCECKPSLTTLITKLQDSNKAMVCTHKIKREERVWIFKTEKIGMEVLVFSVLKIHTLSTTIRL